MKFRLNAFRCIVVSLTFDSRNFSVVATLRYFITLRLLLSRHAAKCPVFDLVYCDFRVAVRDRDDEIKHYRIRTADSGGVFIAIRAIFPDLMQLVEHYEKSSDGLCMRLTAPCKRVSLFLLFCYRA